MADSQVARWYPCNADVSTRKFDDLLTSYWLNPNDEPPFYGHAGDPPEQDIDPILEMLTDGYK